MSVVVACHRGGPFLREAVDSVSGQTLEDWELVLVDDQVEGGAARFAVAGRTRIVTTPIPGPAGAYNAGLASSSGVFVAMLDEDDLWRPEKLSRQVSLMREQPNLGMCHTAAEVIDEDGSVIRADAGRDVTYRELLGGRCGVVHSSVLWRRRALDALGGYDVALRLVSDYDLFLRAARWFPLGFVAEPLTAYRWHSQNASKDHRRQAAEQAVVFARHWQAAAASTDATLRRACVRGRRVFPATYGMPVARTSLQKLREGRLRTGATDLAWALSLLVPGAPGLAIEWLRRRRGESFPGTTHEEIATAPPPSPAIGSVPRSTPRP